MILSLDSWENMKIQEKTKRNFTLLLCMIIAGFYALIPAIVYEISISYFSNICAIACVLMSYLIELTIIITAFILLNQKEDKGKPISERIKKAINSISTEPGENHFKWQGGNSLFAFCVLRIMWIARIFSGLQIIKRFFRVIMKPKTGTKSNRGNISPFFQENYYGAWFISIILLYYFRGQNGISGELSAYFIFESTGWIFYYAVFRRFFEEKYAIYHVLEHIPMILLIIPIQSFAYGTIYQTDFKDILPILLGQATKEHPVISFVGMLYAAIVISIIISSFPAEDIKRSKAAIYIIGAGDVIKNRTYDALVKSEKGRIQKHKIRVFDLKEKDITSKNNNTFSTISIADLPEKASKERELITWIATPTEYHLSYLRQMMQISDLVVVEKPIVGTRQELEDIKTLISSEEVRNRIFFLSYYIIEKALPLTYLKTLSPRYEKYLYVNEEGLDVSKNRKKLFEKMCSLGTLKYVEVDLFEPYDNRPLAPGGQFLETFIHNILIASMYTSNPENWENVEIYLDKNYDNSNQIGLSAVYKDTGICLRLEKNVSDDKVGQHCVLRYQNGTVKADFKKKNAIITVDNESMIIGIRDEYIDNYRVQIELVNTCYDDRLSTEEIDGLYNQIEVLEWIFAQIDGNNKKGNYDSFRKETEGI